MIDLKLVFGDLYNNTYNKKRNLWRVTLCSKIGRFFAELFGFGNRMDKETTFPDFILNKNLPIDFLRQFLSGVFGGDGWAPVLNGNCFTEVYIALSKSKDKLDNLKNYMEKLSELLTRSGVINHNITGPYKNQKGEMYHYRIKIKSSSLLDFSKYIGFAYCCHKSMRLSVVSSYYSLKNLIIAQHNAFKNKYIEEIKIDKNKKNIYKKIKEEMEKTEYIFSKKYSIPNFSSLNSSLRNSSELSNIGGKGFYSPKDYLEEIDGLKFFLKNSYAVEREHGLPTFKLKFLTKKNIGIKKVYDITVDEKIESFVANGIIVHNCPSHCLLLKHINPSYRDLPLRLADFGVLHRNEVHGSLRGLTRVRKFCQDDAHIFCTFNQIESEIKGVLDFIHKVYKDFQMEIKVGLSTRPDQFIGDIETWDKAESILRNLLDELYPGYEINEKDGAFYGNKIDCKVKDAFGREHQLATIQLDFNLPERFELTYKDSSGKDVQPVMIHRAIFGSVERFIGILLESTQGKLPFFVNPRQIAIIPVKTDDIQINDYSSELTINLKNLGYNVDYLNDADTMVKKIALCEVLHYNLIVVIGKKEVDNKTISIRNPKLNLNFEDFVKFLKNN